MSNYINIAQHVYIKSSIMMEITARKVLTNQNSYTYMDCKIHIKIRIKL
jgi:hypothetical protein